MHEATPRAVQVSRTVITSEEVKKERDNQPDTITFEQVTQTATEILLRDGHHIPTVIADGSRGSLILQIADLARTHEGRMQQMAFIGIYTASQENAGPLRNVFFVSEGWMSRRDDGGDFSMPPSQDPNRHEVLIISGVEIASMQRSMEIFEMIRDASGELRELRDFSRTDNAEITGESPLLDAFVYGYLSAGK